MMKTTLTVATIIVVTTILLTIIKNLWKQKE